jgi:hypothetical protein
MILAYVGLAETAMAADQIEDLVATGTDGGAEHLLNFNPAITYSPKRLISALAIQGKRRASVIGSPEGNSQKIKYTTSLEGIGAAFSVPLGGASFGLHYAELREELTALNEQFQIERSEQQVAKDWAFRFVVELTPNLRGGFLYQIRKVENDIHGSFSVNDDDRTVYKGQMAGYRLGAFYDSPKFGLGLYTAPALRGKGVIDSEQKILTEPGSAGLDFYYKGRQKASFSLGVTRWYYKRDDRGELSTSPVDQRTMSLNGLDLRQYMFKTEEYRIGLKYELKRHIFLKAHISRTEAVFLFDDDAVPGDRPDRESAIRLNQYVIGLNYRKNRFSMELAYHLESMVTADIEDPTRKMGHRDYQNYDSEQKMTVLKFSLAN